jgi:aryl-alcohol dehydrogenase-like predicted oxidoreductase
LKKRELGNTGISIFPVILGCGTFGGIGSPAHLIGRGLDEAACMATMDEAINLGIDVFDTSCSYAGGASERYIGRWLSAQSAHTRANLHIATKVGIVVTAQGMHVDLSPANIASQLEGSLERLGIDRVGFCISHAPDTETPIEAALEAFAEQIEVGRVGFIGASNVSAEQLETSLLTSERLGLPRYEWVQNEYNLLRRADEGRMFDLCREHGLGFTPFSPLAGGLLSGKYRRDAEPAPDSRLALRPEGVERSDALFDAIDRLAAAARHRHTSTGSLALAWVMHQSLVTALIAGPSRKPEHLRLAREVLGVDLDDTEAGDIGLLFDDLCESA